MEYMVIILLLFIILLITEKVNSLQAQVRSMKYTLEQIANQFGVPEHPINNELRILRTEGKKIEAVKEARRVLGLSLKEAKEYVEAL
ncbi:ribosomal protein L7/L12 [Paenibacillus apiarius]|uniref:Ribosomal protein L7/L12 n=1 Tax=Paenibacillus apiarius TaxID=46240 RepID=A0ABT4DVU8_9BACL|nr:ribosomal protein L7/L12 [Paenibacillus apiarius]MCY9513173.1 ribosomal protein L7/L12 [Paenibacillus apiarius]MCY9521469.1 ribosomal protein L7/L12 [Paenibacillus apiarius]MCY9551624.1 ribosomal protein L7/L12 [Paenibacillus apiarius]MCY9560589.1 ribosomal protein L7/L12 [Paenibacillus apiarius]MCY9685161.1 ribosomal protein L7/L12 [Paenibacillus apiarius]